VCSSVEQMVKGAVRLATAFAEVKKLRSQSSTPAVVTFCEEQMKQMESTKRAREKSEKISTSRTCLRSTA